MTTLVVAAHADDETLGMGGTIAHLAAGGEEVFVVTMTDGVGARVHGGVESNSDIAILRMREYVAAVTALGGGVYPMGNFPDNGLDTVPLLDVVRYVEGLLQDAQPDTVYTHRRHDLNLDHQLTHRAVLTATRPGTSSVLRVYAFDSPSSSEWNFGAPGFVPSVFQELDTPHILKMEAALAAYKSELRDPPHPRSDSRAVIRRQHWGSVSGFLYAEPFELIRDLRSI